MQAQEYCNRGEALVKVSGDEDIDAEIVEELIGFKKICETWVFNPAISVRRSRKVESRQLVQSQESGQLAR